MFRICYQRNIWLCANGGDAGDEVNRRLPVWLAGFLTVVVNWAIQKFPDYLIGQALSRICN